MTNTTKRTWSKGDKALIIAILTLIPILIAYSIWHFTLEADPLVTVPMPVMPSPNAFDFYTKAANEIVDANKIGFALSDVYVKGSPDYRTYSLSEKQELVSENAKPLALFHKGMAYPYLAPPIRRFDDLMPYLPKERNLARLLALQSETDRERGDWAGATDSALEAVRLGADIPRGSTIIGELVGVACQAIGLRQMWQLADRLPAAQALGAAKRLAAIQKHSPTFVSCLQEEERSSQAGLLATFREPNWRDTLLQSTDTQNNGALQWRLHFIGKRQMMNNFTHLMDQRIQTAQQPGFRLVETQPITDPISSLLLPLGRSLQLRYLATQSNVNLLCVTLALRAYYQKRHSYPQSLTALSPKYLPTIPIDPFDATSAPLRYHLSNGRYTLYSVGPDGKDDGGKPIFDAAKPTPTSPEETDMRYQTQTNSIGDIVAGINVR